MVAETIMKKLYNRNKELEKWYEANSNRQLSPKPLPEPTETLENDLLVTEGNGQINELMSQMKEVRQTYAELEEEIGIKQQIIKRMTEQKIEDFTAKNEGKHSEFMQSRLQELLAENSRYFQKYVDIR